MIRVEQIRLLESKVQKAVSLLSSLQEENTLLKTRLGEYEKRVDDLEYLLEEFKEEQQEIEQGIISALNKLETLETAAKQSQEPSDNNRIEEKHVQEKVNEATSETTENSQTTNSEQNNSSIVSPALFENSSTITVSKDHSDTENNKTESLSIDYADDSDQSNMIPEEEPSDPIDEQYETSKPPELDIF
jgi:chromosome segregation ATPase